MEWTEIYTRAAQGEHAARERLFERAAPRLRVYVEQRLGRALARRVEVDDVLQETALRALGGIAAGKFAGEGPFLAYLCSIARNVLADIARAARRQRRGDGASALSLVRSDWSASGAMAPADASGGPLTKALRSESREHLLAAWRKLSPEHRRVIVLRQFEALSARDAAQRMGSSEQAVHALFRRALGRWGEEFERLDRATSS